MIQYIDKSTLVAEIERIDESIDCDRFLTEFEKGRNLGKEEMCDALLYFLNTLEVKEINLEEKAIQLSHKYFPDEENIWARSNIEAHKCKSACIEMVEWFKAQKGE